MQRSTLSFSPKSSAFVAAIIALCICNFSPVASGQISVDGFSDATNDRFTNDDAFLDVTSLGIDGADLDFSGVGRIGDDGIGRWVTLIGDNTFISAVHRAPQAGTTVTFYADNDPNSTPFTATVLSQSGQAGSTDLFVGYLDRVIDPSIKRYDFATTEIDRNPTANGSVFLDVTSPFQGDLSSIVGVSPTANSSLSIDQAVGLNLVSGYAENVEFRDYTDNDTIVFENNDPNDGVNGSAYVDFEAYAQDGDSGAPSFLIGDDGDLLLLGVNSFQLTGGNPIDVDNPTAGSQFEATGVTYTGNQADNLFSLIAAAPNVTGVPEPSATVVLALMSLFSLKRRRQ